MIDPLAEKYLIALTRIERAYDNGRDAQTLAKIATDAINATPYTAIRTYP